MERRWLLFVVAFVLGALLDLGTKHLAFEALTTPGASAPVTSFFAITLATNEGASFGLLRGRQELFLAVAIAAMAGLPYFVHSAPRRAVAVPIIVGLILSGVLGNLWDRALHGHVRDFLDLHTPAGTRWPTFNVADISITGGAIVLVLLHGRDAKAAPVTSPRPGLDVSAWPSPR